MNITAIVRLSILVIALILTGCATTQPPPRNKENINAIFKEYPKWYKAAKKTEKKWGVPVNVQMAIIYYESAFRGDARPPRKCYFGMIPGKHITTAYGYAQALDGTWDDYLAAAGGWCSKRNKFESATDFIGWYSCQVKNRLGISQEDPFNLYLAYHEGLGGYRRKSFLKKPWLIAYAKKVAIKSHVFENQLAGFEGRPTPMYMPLHPLPHDLPTPLVPDLEAPAYYATGEVESSDDQMVALTGDDAAATSEEPN